MYAVDVNVLVYARFEGFPHHHRALGLLSELRSSPSGLVLFPAVVAGFLRVATHRRIVEPPLTAEIALSFIDEILLSPSVAIASPGNRYWLVLRSMVNKYTLVGNDVSDIALAAAAVEIDVTWVSFDRGFARFDEVRWLDPRSD